MSIDNRKKVRWRAPMMAENFEAIADAAVAAMFFVDGRIEPTASATYSDGGGYDTITATRKFKAQLRKELKERGFDVWAKHREKGAA